MRQSPRWEGKRCQWMLRAKLISLKVDSSLLPCLAQWKRDYTMETILIELRRYMALPKHKKLPQPPEGTNF